MNPLCKNCGVNIVCGLDNREREKCKNPWSMSSRNGKTNREVFKEVFGFYPNESIHSRFAVCIRGRDCDTYCDLQTTKRCVWWDEDYKEETDG